MNEDKARAQDYIPFVPNSVNILTASTNSGKTTFLINTLKHLQCYYSGPVEGVIVVLCNPCVDGDIYKQLESEHFTVDIEYCETFETSSLKENFVLIFEDVSVLTSVILAAGNVLHPRPGRIARRQQTPGRRLRFVPASARLVQRRPGLHRNTWEVT